MAALVCGAPNSHVGIQSVLVVVSEHFHLPLLTIKLEEISEFDEASVFNIKLGDEFCQLDFGLFDADPPEGCIKVIYGNDLVSVVI